MKEKVLIVHNYYQIPGGEDTVVTNEKKLLEDNGHQVLLYTRHNSEIKRMNFLKKLLLPLNMIFNLRTYREIRRLIRKENIQIVHVHNTLNLISPAAYYAAVSLGVPVVQTVHNFRLLCPGATFYRDGHICEDCVTKGLGCALKHKCYRGSRLQTLACVVSTKIHRAVGIYKKLRYICLTEFNREKLLQFKGIRPEQIFVKPNFVEAKEHPVPWEERQGFVYAGRLDKQKGVDLLLKAWKMLAAQGPELTVFGTGPMEVWCRKFLADNAMTNVRLAGFVPNEQAKYAASRARAMILPTQLYEGLPMSMVEAFSMGTPVVASDLGNAGALIEPGINGWKFNGASPESLAEAVLAVRDITQSTWQCYCEKYTAQRNYEQLVKIYQAVR